MADLDDVVADLDYPMFVVTAAAAGTRAGCLVGFAAQCSIDPPLFMVWVSTANRTSRVVERAGHVGVHVLPAGRFDLAELFGGSTGDEVDKFARCAWHAGPHDVPLLDEVPRWFVGRIRERVPTGDHVGLLLEPVAAGAGPWTGQLAFQRARTITPGHPA